MKRTLKSTLTYQKCLSNLAVLLLFVLSFGGKASAQCLLTSYDISTANNTGWPLSSLSAGVNDPFWYISAKDSRYNPGSPAVGSPALLVPPAVFVPVGWSGGGWICDNATHADATIGIDVKGTDAFMTFSRKFKLAASASVTINLGILCDDYIADVLIDGTSTGHSQTAAPSVTNHTNQWDVPAIVRNLSCGEHTLDIVVGNAKMVSTTNATGLLVQGNITSATAVFVNDYSEDCQDIVYDCSCDESCYWRLEGNHIISGRNIFGTLSNDDIDIQTNSKKRGVIQGGNSSIGGYLGWNTTSPTARLHVNCNNGNNEHDHNMGLSDIRFEDLEPGAGSVLVIDDAGYVYNSGLKLHDDGSIGMMAMQNEVRDLKIQLAELRSTLAAGKPYENKMGIGNELYQNNPNPFGVETSIGYNIVRMQQSAFVAIYDLNGRELYRYAVTTKGKGSVTVSGDKLVSGQYLYSLIVDGREEATKRMVVSK